MRLSQSAFCFLPLFPIFAPMKNITTLLLLTIALQACNNQQAPVNKTDSAPLPLPVVDNGAPLDTLILGKTKLIVYPLAQSPFTNKVQIEDEDAEPKNIKRDASFVKRSGDSLIFRTQSGASVALRNNQTEGGEYVGYRYDQIIPEINVFGINVSYYESGDYVILDRNSGDTTHLWAKPVVSPDKKRLICPSYDLEARFIPNGFQLLEYNNGKINLLGEIELDNWGPGQVKWLDNNTLAAEYVTMVDNKETGHREVKKIVKIVIR